MDTIYPYGKLNEADQERLIERRKTRRRITIIAISSFVLVAIVIATVVGVSATKHNNKSSLDQNSLSNSIKSICSNTLYPDSCYTSLAPAIKSRNLKPQDLYKLSVQVAINELSKSSTDFLDNGVKKLNITDKRTLAAVESCGELFSLALDHLNMSSSLSIITTDTTKLLQSFDDLRTWLSSAGTYQQTCIDELLTSSNGSLNTFLNDNFKNSGEYTSNSLSIITSFADSLSSLGAIGKRRRLMSLLPVSVQIPSISGTKSIKADVVVAKDGSGKYKTIGDALNDVPEKSGKRFVIYVKKGVYFENVNVGKNMWNVMMVGDGKDATIVSAALNVVDGTPTFQSATFAVSGQGFIAINMAFRNTAGAIKQQAVALLSTADLSIFYRCTIDAFQDTLYAHSNRQFYRECDIYGTVDFIFGNSAVVFQNCNILPRKPIPGQQNTITAQGKFDPNQNTGISIQNCNISPAVNLDGVRTYLGRPWKNYSTTVFFENQIGGFVDPKGWLPWIGNSAPNTIFYGEYQNSGAGAVTKSRVNWKGVKLNLSAPQVKLFTVGKFINGDRWIPATGVTYKSGL